MLRRCRNGTVFLSTRAVAMRAARGQSAAVAVGLGESRERSSVLSHRPVEAAVGLDVLDGGDEAGGIGGGAADGCPGDRRGQALIAR